MDEKQAVIDIGSNTIRLVIYGGPPRAPAVLLNEKVTVRLGKGIAETGLLSRRSKTAALAALHRFSVILKASGISRVETVATAATRDAANGAQFLEQVAALGLQPRQLTGEEEALVSAMGVAGAFPDARGTVADLGGGSLELVRIKGRSCKRGTSLPLGTLRLPSLYEGGAAKFRKRITRQVLDSGWTAKPGETLYLVGGAFRALARYTMFQARSPLDDPHGLEIGPEQALAACLRLSRARIPVSVPGVSTSRLASMPHAAALLAALVHSLQPSRIVFSAWGLREGLVFTALEPAMQDADPLLAGVEAFATTMGLSQPIVGQVADWIAPACGQSEPGSNRLVRASIMLAIASRRIEPNLRAPTLLDWALHKRWIGIDAPQRAMMATCLMADSNRLMSVDVVGLAEPEQIAEAVGWGLTIRLCRRLTGLAPTLIEGCQLSADDGRLVLRLEGECGALAVESVERDLRLLAEHLGLEPVIERV